MYYYDLFSSPAGILHIVSDGEAITRLWIEGQKHAGKHTEEDVKQASLPVFAQARAWLERYFNGENPGGPPIIRLHGTPFQLRVWQFLQAIPYGETVTYGSIARRIANEYAKEKMSAQAIGNAVGRNPVSLLVPCHRVVGADGSLTGYAGGLDIKRYLLKLEQKGCARHGDNL